MSRYVGSILAVTRDQGCFMSSDSERVLTAQDLRVFQESPRNGYFNTQRLFGGFAGAFDAYCVKYISRIKQVIGWMQRA